MDRNSNGQLDGQLENDSGGGTSSRQNVITIQNVADTFGCCRMLKLFLSRIFHYILIRRVSSTSVVGINLILMFLTNI